LKEGQKQSSQGRRNAFWKSYPLLLRELDIMKTAVIQLNAANDKQRNIEKALLFVNRAITQKAKFILLPEAFNFRGKADLRKGYADVAESIPGPSTLPLTAAAKKYKVFILAGSICELVPGRKKVFNTSVLMDDRGKIIAQYRKIHLFDAVIGNVKVKESRRLYNGRTVVMSKIGTWTVGMSICYDLRFPELYQKYARKGAEILCVPSVFTKMTGQAHWETLLRARAIENLCYVLAPNQIGRDGNGVPSYGNSMIIDPWGKILARTSGSKEEIIYATLDKKTLKDRRIMLPGQGKRRFS